MLIKLGEGENFLGRNFLFGEEVYAHIKVEKEILEVKPGRCECRRYTPGQNLF